MSSLQADEDDVEEVEFISVSHFIYLKNQYMISCSCLLSVC